MTPRVRNPHTKSDDDSVDPVQLIQLRRLVKKGYPILGKECFFDVIK